MSDWKSNFNYDIYIIPFSKFSLHQFVTLKPSISFRFKRELNEERSLRITTQRDLALIKEDSLGLRESENNLRGARATTLGVRSKIRTHNDFCLLLCCCNFHSVSLHSSLFLLGLLSALSCLFAIFINNYRPSSCCFPSSLFLHM